jgi:hypothetical protein
MGLLDDAIREHLELKRRHGADPQEVLRQEDEALGPIGGQEPHDEDEDEREPPEVNEDQLALVDEPPAPYDQPAAVEDEGGGPPHVAEEPAEEPAFDVQQPTVEFSVEDEAQTPPAEDEDEREPPEVNEDQLALVDEPPPQVVEEPPEEPADEPAFDVQQPTVEFSVEDEAQTPPAEDEDEDATPADELEETPEFLQETPEHDRLWFEQKPPRDFDF